MTKKYLLISAFVFAGMQLANAQCTITSPGNTCASDSPFTLTGNPAGGVFSGTGITGSVFDPAAAGPGTHAINYEGYSTIYTINQTGTFAPLTGTGTPVSLSDDEVSLALPIGFTFEFFDVSYTDFYISSNGFITFNGASGSGCCGGQLIPDINDPNNLIAFAWDDMYPPGAGSIEYFTTGTAPNRILVVNYTDVPFCCGSTPAASAQILLYEGTNVIEIHTLYATGMDPATQGIENADGTIAYPVPGRNSTSWSVTNDYVSFTPDSVLCTATTNIEVSGFSYAAVYCAADPNPLPVVTGLTGGTFTSTPAGLTINGTSGEIDIAASAPGVYDVTYDGQYTIAPLGYSIDQSGTFNPLSGTGTAVSLGDDQVSAAVPIGFSFEFYTVAYTDLYISSNGFITFTNDPSSGCCSGQIIPDAAAPNNLIAIGWTDLYPPGSGSIEYFVTGTSPNQMMVVNFLNIPLCCGSIPVLTSQVILYEGSNIIEIHTTTADNLGAATMGVEDASGSAANPVTGRNSSTWSLTNDYVAFIPLTANCASTVSVIIDNIAPTITAPANVTVNVDAGACDASGVALGSPVTADNCNVASVINDGLTNYPAGTTNVTWTVTDASGNTATAVQTVTVVDNILPAITAPADVTIAVNAPNCTAINVPLGLPVVTDNCTGTTITNDSLVIYSVGTTTVTWTVTDANGNVASAAQLVTVTNDFTIDTIISVDASCSNTTDGSADLSVSGGTAPYTYNWNSGAFTTQDLMNIGAGTYNVIAVDDNGCEAISSVMISSSPAINATATTTNEVNGSDGMIDLTVTGGVGPYTYLWSNAATTEDLNGLTGGTYTVTVTDNNGCTAVLNVVVSSEVGIAEEEQSNVFNVYPNPASGVFTVELVHEQKISSLSITNVFGQSVKEISNPSQKTTIDMTGFSSGIYFITIETAEGKFVKRVIMN
jgi:hypothetical protein